MSVAYIEQIRGLPYMSKKGIAKEFDMSVQTVNRRIEGIQDEILRGRYSPYAILDSGNLLINVYVFADYEKYRKALQSKNVRKNIPEFNPDEIMKISGYCQKVVKMEE